jgi:peptide/nickel transport system substrate-binding protein
MRRLWRIQLFVLLFLGAFFFPAAGLYAADEQAVVISAWEADGFDPLLSGYIFIRMSCIEPLARSDRSGGVEPCLAEKWSLSEDGLVWKFDIRPNVVFHDGTELTADAASKALNRTFSKGSLFKGTPVVSITAEGNSVIVTTSRPFSPLPWYLANYAAAVFAPGSFDADGNCVAVIGTGRYKMTSYEGKTVFDFELFDKYWGHADTNITKARYLAVTSPETRAMMAESGEGHVVVDIPAESAAYLSELPEVKVVNQLIPRVRSLILNAGLPALKTPDLRKAVSLAIDRKGIAAAIHKDESLAATQLLADITPWHIKDLGTLAYNPQEASEIFAKDGWKLNGNSILEKEGKELELEILTYTSRPDLPVVAQALQEQLAKVGIKVTIAIDSSSVINARHDDGTLQTALLGRNYSLVPDPIGNIAADFSNPRDSMGAMNWNSSKVDDAARAYMEAFDPKTAQEARREIMSVLQQELPVLPITWYSNQIAVSEKIENTAFDPYELRGYLEGARWKK